MSSARPVQSLPGIQTASALLSKKSDGIFEKIDKYCLDKLINLGVAPKNATVSFESAYNKDRPLPPRTILKLKNWVSKYIIKSIPYLEFATSEFMTSIHDNQADFVIKSDYEYLDTSNIYWNGNESSKGALGDLDIANNDSYRNTVVTNLKINLNLVRYVRYLNYKFRKYRVPIMASIHTTLIPNEFEFREVSKINDPSNKRKGKIKFSIQSNISFGMVVWRRRGTVTPIEGELIPDNVLSNTEVWSQESYSISRATGSPSTSFPKLNIFKHFKDGLKILQSLTRKANYAAQAYSFRSG